MLRICQINYPEAAFHGQAVKTVAYLRVSTPQQDVSSQRLAILEYAQKHDLHIDDFIEATASGQASEKRRRLDELTSALQPGDRLVVSELSRLGRSLGQVVAVLDALAKAGVAFVALKENIRVEGKRDIQTKVMTTLFAGNNLAAFQACQAAKERLRLGGVGKSISITVLSVYFNTNVVGTLR